MSLTFHQISQTMKLNSWKYSRSTIENRFQLRSSWYCPRKSTIFNFTFFIHENKSILQSLESSTFEKNFRVIFEIIGIQFSDVNELKHSLPKTGSHPSLSRAPPQSTRARTKDNIAPETRGNNKEEKLTRTKFYLMADSPSLGASSFGTGFPPPKSLPNNFSPVAQWIRHQYYKKIILKSEKLLKKTED